MMSSQDIHPRHAVRALVRASEAIVTAMARAYLCVYITWREEGLNRASRLRP